MTLALLQTVLGYCVALNYAVLLLWFAAFLAWHDGLYRLHARWFRLSRGSFDAVHYAGMAAYKIGILLLNLVPLLALWLARR